VIRENVQLDCRSSDIFESQSINSGHGIEAMWFLIDIGLSCQDKSLMELAANTIITTLEYSWNTEFGELSSTSIGMRQRLWWAHFQTFIAPAKAMEYIENYKLKKWYIEAQGYSLRHCKNVGKHLNE